MLDALRRGAGTWVAKIFIGLLVLSFAVWGIADIFTGYRGDALVTIGETEVPGEQYRYELQTEMQNVGRQIGRPLTMQEARAIGLDAQVLGRLITQATLDEKARSWGLNMSNAAIATAITEDPQFQTPSGQFDRSYFEQVLRATGRSEAGFVVEKRREMLRQAIGNALSAGAVPSQAMRSAVHAYSNEQRSMDYFVLSAADIAAIGEPDETALSEFFEANKQRFAAPEYRKLAVVSVDPASMAPSIEITEDEARREYEARIDSYRTPERRDVRQIVFATREEADTALSAIRGGKSFDDIAAERGLTPEETQLGMVARGDIVDTTVADAAFALQQDTVSDVIDGQFGFVLALVGAIEPGSERTFEEAREQIIAALQLSRAESTVLDLYDEVEDARAAGQTLAEIAAAKRLELITIDAIDSTGSGPDGNAVEGVPAAAELVREAFASDVGLENDPLQLRGTTFIWYEVTGIEPARERPLDEVRERAIAAWKDDQQSNALASAAASAVTAMEGGKPITSVASDFGKSVTTARNLKRTDTNGPVGRRAVERLFILANGKAAQTPSTDGANRIVFEMTGANVPPPDLTTDDAATIAEQLALATSNDILAQYVGGLEGEFDIAINRDLLNLLLGEPAN